MATDVQTAIDIPADLIEAIESLPTERHVSHCGTEFAVSPFDIYATCPTCGERLKVRAFSGNPDLEDVFDAVFQWMASADHRAAALVRIQELEIEQD